MVRKKGLPGRTRSVIVTGLRSANMFGVKDEHLRW